MLKTLQDISRTAAFNQWAGIEVTAASAGSVELSMPWRPQEMGQYSGFLHAGLIGGLLDTACGFAAATTVGNVLASHFSVNCLAPAVGERFVVRGQIIKAGKKQVFASAELFAQQDAELVATGNAILVPVPI
jgi:uncharacterized protein (TIGR00369 family)